MSAGACTISSCATASFASYREGRPHAPHSTAEAGLPAAKRTAFEHHHPETHVLVAFPSDAWPHLLAAMRRRTRTTGAWSGKLTPRRARASPPTSSASCRHHVAAAALRATSDDDRHGRRAVPERPPRCSPRRRYRNFSSTAVCSSPSATTTAGSTTCPNACATAKILASPEPSAAATARWSVLLKLRQRRLTLLKRAELALVADAVQPVSLGQRPLLYCLDFRCPATPRRVRRIEIRKSEFGKSACCSPRSTRLIYDRTVSRQLWGTDYTWEVYTPPHKRVRGYYALPILAGHELVGHVDPKADREAKKLRVMSRSVRRGHRVPPPPCQSSPVFSICAETPMPTATQPDLDQLLKRTFGYGTFRPLQREIIAATLAGQDVFALLPTGGGKSLCFQLPALARPGLTVVVSAAHRADEGPGGRPPGQRRRGGLSQLHARRLTESRARLRGLHRGEFKLLYAAPERLMIDGWVENLKAWNVSCIAIDEAHTASRSRTTTSVPSTANNASSRVALPGVPRHGPHRHGDGPRPGRGHHHASSCGDPATFVASFNRPNLTYRVIPKRPALKQIIDFVPPARARERHHLLRRTRAATERVAGSRSSAAVLPPRAYHAGPHRRRTQWQPGELFLRDDTRIICATIAFGMGIDKPNVRWIMHHDLPKNIEAVPRKRSGRAGHVRLPGDCLLLFSAGDIAKQTHFLDEITNEQEQQGRPRTAPPDRPPRRRQFRLPPPLSFADTSAKNSSSITAAPATTASNCATPTMAPSWRPNSSPASIASHKLARFDVGMNHIIEVLTGADNEKTRRWGHDRLTTYGIGAELSRPQWAAVGRELMRLGYVAVAEGEYATLQLTEEGMACSEAARTSRSRSRWTARRPGA